MKKRSIPSAAPTKERAAASPSRPLCVVGMGGSAGALEAFEAFFRATPTDLGVAFVLVPHLDPTHKGVMPEILQRYTSMKVLEAKDGLIVQPSHVYVIPPNRDMVVFHGTLQLLAPSAPRGLRMSIDFFFRALAEDQGENAVCILLSGMGTDGTLGLKAVKERLGMVMVQEPSSAHYPSMPQSAIDTGLVDYVASAETLPQKLAEYLAHASRGAAAARPVTRTASGALTRILALLRTTTGHDFALYKRTTVSRRIQRRMGLHRLATLELYARYLQESPHEIDLLFKELLIGVTSFFRDPELFQSLKARVLSQLPGMGERQGLYRVWVPGCSTGEEAFSIAILLHEALDELGLSETLRVQIYATDIDREAIDKARQAVFPPNIAADVTPARLQRYFHTEPAGYRLRREIRETVVFAPQDVLVDPPFAKLDLLSCRNLLIYLTPEPQKKLIPLFHFLLKPGGLLFLGSSESINGFTPLFSTLDFRAKVFLRREVPSGMRPAVSFPTAASRAPPEGAAAPRSFEMNVEHVAQRLVVERISPPVVLINGEGDILYLTQRTGKYLEPPVGKADLNVFAMAREGLRAELGAAVRKAVAHGVRVTVRGLRIGAGDGADYVNLTVDPVSEPEALRGMLVVAFEEAPAPGKTGTATRRGSRAPTHLEIVNAELEKELRYTKEHLQTVAEEMETSQEELKSTNEELQSTNEELQSTIEEMSTSKEELQSLNEELSTVNAELQAKNEEQTRASDDMHNLLDSTQIPTLFLDGQLRVRRFTPQATRIANLIPGDVGRPVSDIMPGFQHGDLMAGVKEVLGDRVPRETQIQLRDGSWFVMRIHPYRTMDNAIDGVVVTFSEITALKDLEATLRREGGEEPFRTILDPWPGCVYIYDIASRRNAYVNQAASALLGMPREGLLAADGALWTRMLHPDDAGALGSWDSAFASLEPGRILEREYRLHDAGGGWRCFVDRVSVLSSAADGTPRQVLGILEDITQWRAP